MPSYLLCRQKDINSMAEKNKICPRCKKEFKCNAENISACSCSQVVLSNETKSFLANTFFNCLCNDCLTELNRLVATTKEFPFQAHAMWWLFNRKGNDWRSFGVEEAMKQANNVTRDSLAETVSVRHDAYRQSKSDADLTSLLQAAKTYDAILTAKPELIFHEFRLAHANLTKALNNDKVTWDQAFASLAVLKTDADQLSNIVSDLLTAAEKERS